MNVSGESGSTSSSSQRSVPFRQLASPKTALTLGEVRNRTLLPFLFRPWKTTTGFSSLGRTVVSLSLRVVVSSPELVRNVTTKAGSGSSGPAGGPGSWPSPVSPSPAGGSLDPPSPVGCSTVPPDSPPALPPPPISVVGPVAPPLPSS